MPAEFVDRFGPMLPSWIGLSCNNILWVINYDLQKRQIYGIGKFVRFYRLRIFNMAQLDYCGEGLFVVTLFNDTALETNYPVGNPHNLVMDKEWEEQNRNDYVVRTGTFQLERCQTSILFNGCSNKDGFANKSWEIQINKTDESCSFGKGWRVFHEEVGLKEGDYIVAFRERGKGNQQLELCIYRGEDHIYDFETGQVDSLSNTTQEGHMIEDAAVNEDSFTAKLTSGNLDKKTHGLFIPEALKPANGRWMRSQKFNFITDKGLWKIGISLTANKPRFSAGWNSFVRGNKYTPGQHLHFRMVEQEGLIEFHISKI
ncbi:hypothetical protein ACET3Z_021280 [Daucus carota]